MKKKEREAILKRMKKELNKENQREDSFWKEDYPKLSCEEKYKVWSIFFFHSIRWNGESTNDEIAIFSNENYNLWKQREAKIDKFLELLIPKISVFLGGGFEKRINDRLGR